MNALTTIRRATATPLPVPAIEPLALELFYGIPGRHIVHAAEDNRNAPLIRRGEIVVVESDGRAGWLPTEGGLFLIEHRSKVFACDRYERANRSIVQTFFGGTTGRWYASHIRRGLATDGQFYCADGPYNDACHLAEHLIGKVVGLLACSLVQGRA